MDGARRVGVDNGVNDGDTSGGRAGGVCAVREGPPRGGEAEVYQWADSVLSQGTVEEEECRDKEEGGEEEGASEARSEGHQLVAGE
mmetsp:Transcript_12547/g.25481  ORF Transcript_12547/g.25481 Transcript_12547/m.25481 type:complete len:86 (+) Transcript_12547:326-583(+)